MSPDQIAPKETILSRFILFATSLSQYVDIFVVNGRNRVKTITGIRHTINP